MNNLTYIDENTNVEALLAAKMEEIAERNAEVLIRETTVVTYEVSQSSPIFNPIAREVKTKMFYATKVIKNTSAVAATHFYREIPGFFLTAEEALNNA